MEKYTPVSYKPDIKLTMDSSLAKVTTVPESLEEGTAVSYVKQRHPETYSEQDHSTMPNTDLKSNGSSVFSFGDVRKIKTQQMTKPESRKTSFFRTVANWVGEVVEVSQDQFLARVYEEKNGNSSSEEYDDYVEFSSSEISDGDKGIDRGWCSI